MRRISFLLVLIALLTLCLCACEKSDPLTSKDSVTTMGDTVMVGDIEVTEESGDAESGTSAPAETEYTWTERF